MKFILYIFFTATLFGNFASLGTLDNINHWSEQKNYKKIKKVVKKSPIEIQKELEISTIKKAKSWLDALDVNLEEIAAKKYGDKKRLSEILGAYWMLYRYSTKDEQKEIHKRMEVFYNYTLKPQYLNLLTQDAKQFKKNSMSYLRIMHLLKEMNFDVTHLLKRFEKLKPRMDEHFKIRGAWQKSMFANYYDMFGFKKPNSIAHTQHMTGIIGQELSLDKYGRSTVYMLTHQIFVAFNYGEKRVQTRFNAKELAYLKAKLPIILRHYLARDNWDLLAELLSCMTYLDLTKNRSFQKAYTALMKAQNENGSWGYYERLRKKYGKMTDVKYYLHTTGVALGAILEKSRGDWDKK